MAGELVERNTLIAILCRLTTNPGRDHRSGQEFVVAGSSQEIVDALRQAAVILRRDNSRIEALERENATLRAERDEARKLAIEEAALIAEAEPEFEEEPSPKVIEAMIAVGPMNNARAACAVTKKSIAAAIRNMGGEG